MLAHACSASQPGFLATTRSGWISVSLCHHLARSQYQTPTLLEAVIRRSRRNGTLRLPVGAHAHSYACRRRVGLQR